MDSEKIMREIESLRAEIKELKENCVSEKRVEELIENAAQKVVEAMSHC